MRNIDFGKIRLVSFSGLEFRLTCVFNGAALSMVPAGFKKVLSFRAVELALRLDLSRAAGGGRGAVGR